jgi:hypothetical protein
VHFLALPLTHHVCETGVTIPSAPRVSSKYVMRFMTTLTSSSGINLDTIQRQIASFAGVHYSWLVKSINQLTNVPLASIVLVIHRLSRPKLDIQSAAYYISFDCNSVCVCFAFCLSCLKMGMFCD